ncbi:hypothetical protein HGRIS_007565 [Hohenbuehelia grisea]|uniref:Mediator of RNA polymerase II transcription subunit 6 n=1 Tax=Hohenbuehelia grisea TaxID=104357 RepID=A0ABR3J6N1_9AGAR
MEADLFSEDPNESFFIFPEFLAAHQLATDDAVWDYFRSSGFWDTQCNNAILDMQTMYVGAQAQGLRGWNPEQDEQLKRFTGLEFSLVYRNPPLFWVIHKRERISPDEVRVLNVYFIMNDIIIPAPNIYSVISSRLYSTVSALQTSLDTLRSYRPDYTPHTGYVWPIGEPAFSDAATKNKKQETDTPGASANTESDMAASAGPISRHLGALGSTKRQQNHMLLYNAMMATGAHQRSIDPTGKFASAVANMQTSDTQGSPSAASPGPVVASTPAATPGPPKTPVPQEGAAPKGVPGAGKKKRKRTLVAGAQPS